MLAELINYTAKADAIIIEVLIEAELAEANTLFSHVLNAQNVWANRVLKQQPDFTVWQNSEAKDFKSISENNFALINEILASTPLNLAIDYSNSQGNFNSTVSEILLHICNHSTYHRAQIASILRKANIIPPNTDYIMLKRSNQL